MDINIIEICCLRLGVINKTSDVLAEAIQIFVAMKQMTRVDFLSAVVAAGGVRSELSPLYMYSSFMADIDEQLLAGNLINVQFLVVIARDLVRMSQSTIEAINTVVDKNSLRMVDVVALELNQIAPAIITASDIDNALSRLMLQDGILRDDGKNITNVPLNKSLSIS